MQKRSRRSWQRVSDGNVVALRQRRERSELRRRRKRRQSAEKPATKKASKKKASRQKSSKRFRIAKCEFRIDRKSAIRNSHRNLVWEKIVGQKVHPYGFRLGYNKDWHSHWFAKKQYGEFLLEDLKLKRDLKQRFAGAGVSHVDIERAANRLKIIIYTSRPGIIIGRKGAEIDKLKSDLSIEDRTGSAGLDPGDPQARAERSASG